MRQRSSKVGAIDVNGAELRKVALLATWAKHFETTGSENVTQANRQHFLFVAKRSGAVTKNSLQVLIVYFCKSGGRGYKSSVDQPVKV